MLAINECSCKCPGCRKGQHCGILDNNCNEYSFTPMPEGPKTDEEMLREDEIREATGLYDFNSLGETSLDPLEKLDGDDEPWGDDEEE